MHSNRGTKVMILSLLLLISSLTIIFTPIAPAQSTGDVTTLYFKDSLNFDFYNYDEYSEFGDFFGLTPMSQTPPTKQNDSEFPPSLIIKNTTKLIPKYDINDEEWLLWVTGWSLMFLEDLEDFNLTDLFDLLGEDLEGYDLELFTDLMFQNPLRIVGSYNNNANESIEIDENVIFNLYFDTERKILPKNYDNIEIGLYSMNMNSIFPLPKLISNKTVRINHKPLSNIITTSHEIELGNVSYILKPGESLLFSIKIIPSEKIITKMLTRDRFLEDFFRNRIDIFINKHENNSNRPKLQELAIFIDEIRILIEDFNVTRDDIGMIIDAIRSSSFLYDSVSHPSSVSVPFTIPSDKENTKVFYLHNGFFMDSSKPTNTSNLNSPITTTPLIWNGEGLGVRNKIIKDVVVNLYIRNLRLKKPVAVTLYDDETEIVSQTQDVGVNLKNNIISYKFEDLNYEIFYNHNLNLGIYLSNGSFNGLLRKTKLFYDSETNPSSLTVTFTETDNIKLEIDSEPEDKKIIPFGELIYKLKINSIYDDEIDLNISENKNGDWSYSINSELPISINAGESEEITITIKSENNKKEAYGDTIDLTFIVSGKTGIDQKSSNIEVSEDAIEYDIGLYGQQDSKNINKGSSGTFYFIIENNNTGAIDDEDSYTIFAESENEWELKFTDSISSLEIGDKTDSNDVKVIVFVPKNTTYESDTIKLTVTSDSNPEVSATINVTVNVNEKSIFESIYNIFESAANSLGLDEVFGENAPYALAGILIIIVILIIIFIIIFVFMRKFVNIICTNRIKEIEPNGEATFNIKVQNPTRKPKTYQILSNVNPISPNWQIATDIDKITIDPKKSKQIVLVVKPNDTIKQNSWTEAKLLINVLGKNKIKDITTMVMIKDGKSILQIKDVFNYPKLFKNKDRILTSFKLFNKGNITAKNKNVLLFINGKQKNKVVVTVPHGGYADITIPWIAQKGKNKLQLKVID